MNVSFRLRMLSIFFLFPALLVLGFAPAVLAKKPCEQSDKGERLKCKSENMGEELDVAVTLLTGGDTDFLSPTQKQNLKNARDRAKNAASRPDTREYKRLTRKADPNCYVAEYVNPDDPEDDGDNDGVCITKGSDKEICLEVIDDQIGDDDGKCEVIHTTGKPVQEVCVKVCDPETVEADEENFDDSISVDLEQGIEDTTAALESMNTEVAAYVEWRVYVQALEGEPQPGTGACSTLLEGRQREFSFATLEGLQAGATASKLAADTCRDYCTQTTFGFNCRGLCTFFSVAENVLQAVAAGAEMQDDTVTAERVDAAMLCLDELGSKLDGLDEKLDDIIDLLNTPQGRREEFPLKN